MFWYPRKGAFFAGRALNNDTDHDSIGLYSANFGYNNKTIGGQGMTAMGTGNIVRSDGGPANGNFAGGANIDIFGSGSAGIGIDGVIQADFAAGMGDAWKVFADGGVAIQFQANVGTSGLYGTAFGVSAEQYGENGMAIGRGVVGYPANAFTAGLFTRADSTADQALTFARHGLNRGARSVLIGSGVNGSNRLTNTLDDALVFGMGSITPTIVMTDKQTNLFGFLRIGGTDTRFAAIDSAKIDTDSLGFYVGANKYNAYRVKPAGGKIDTVKASNNAPILLAINSLRFNASQFTLTDDGTGAALISLYTAPAISSFQNKVKASGTWTSFTSSTTVETGTSIDSTMLQWTVNKAVSYQALNQSIGSISVDARSYTHASTYTTSRTYIDTVKDGVSTATSSTSISFQQYNYWGADTTSVPASASIKALSKGFATSGTKGNTSITTTTGQYWYYAYPNSYTQISLSVGFNGGTPTPNTDFKVDTVTVLNGVGTPVVYKYHRFRQNQIPAVGTYVFSAAP